MNENNEEIPFRLIFLKDGIPAKGYDEACDPGWYWHDAEYPEEGCCGPFATEEEAENDAKAQYEAAEELADE